MSFEAVFWHSSAKTGAWKFVTRLVSAFYNHICSIMYMDFFTQFFVAILKFKVTQVK